MRYRNDDGVGTGTLTSLTGDTGITLTPDPITTTGTIALETLAPDPAGTYGDSANIAQVTIDSQGRVTAAADVGITLPSFTVFQASLSGNVDITALPDAGGNLAGINLSLDPGTYLLSGVLDVSITTTGASGTAYLRGRMRGSVQGTVLFGDQIKQFVGNSFVRDSFVTGGVVVVTSTETFDWQVFKAAGTYTNIVLGDINGGGAEIQALKLA